MRPQVPSPQGKPVLDEREFQLLLAAAYALQAQNAHPPAKEAKVDHAQTVSCRASIEAGELIRLPEKDALEPAQSAVHFALPLHAHRPVGTRFLLSDELFWKVAIAVTVAAVSALLLGASMHRFSPFPARVLLPSEVGQKPMPFQGTKLIVGSPAPISSVKPNTGATELSAAKTAATSIVAPAVIDLPSASVSLASAQTNMMKTRRFHAARSRADIIAKDTVIRYGPDSAFSSLEGRKNEALGNSLGGLTPVESQKSQ